MAHILAALATNRRGGFTASVLAEACAGAEEISGVETETVCLARYEFKPCLSSFWCARNGGKGCVLPDDMGRRGDGALYRKVVSTNGLLLATPVHTWGPSALAHLFWERLYPFLYSDGLNGMPFATMACATNQGFHRQAIEEMTKWAFCRGTLYLGGLAAHVMDRDSIYVAARQIGRRMGEAAVCDESDGRQKFADQARFARFSEQSWAPLEPYLDNITEGSFKIEGSLPDRALQEGMFRKAEAQELVRAARDEFVRVLEARQKGELNEANEALSRASAYWTRATWKEYVEDYISKRDDVEPYRQLPHVE